MRLHFWPTLSSVRSFSRCSISTKLILLLTVASLADAIDTAVPSTAAQLEASDFLAEHSLPEVAFDLGVDAGDLNGVDGAEEEAPAKSETLHSHVTHERCRWGTPGCHSGTAAASVSSAENSSDTTIGGASGSNNIPFVPPGSKKNSNKLKASATTGSNSSGPSPAEESDENATVRTKEHEVKCIHHEPPAGYTLTAHIVTDATNGLSYFLDTYTSSSSSEYMTSINDLQIPFLECGAIGSTTPPIPLKHGTFRHFPHGADPTSWSTVGSSHPQLVVALHPLEITVSGNGEETRLFEAGSVILLEDVLGKGHKMRAATGNAGAVSTCRGDKDLSVLMLTLPHTHHHHYHKTSQHANNNNERGNKKKGSIFGLGNNNKKSDMISDQPCKFEHDPAYTALLTPTSYKTDVDDTLLRQMLSLFPINVTTRRTVLASIGLSTSLLMSYFLAKVAPLQLAVGVGGACMVAGGTACVVKGGEWVLEELEMTVERRRLGRRQAEVSEEIEREKRDKNQQSVDDKDKERTTEPEGSALNEKDETLNDVMSK